ncbi:ATP-dependent helicase HrpB [Thalassospira marina]|uniref:ATP-dependent helicase HrpB n=1 Tax=Thalassospira marina TaxID=2048283 RepID=A0A2N3L0G1_9PROT|nr:ATP-dependent helicase HrpB [Thalassospira marina]PKR56226.1 ATP-dependent helicase HrpB [Thalassospira marina]
MRSDFPSLPINAVLADVKAALNGGTNAVLQAPPGAGKTTMVPLALLGENWLAGRKIVMLEPRRLAARASARRMAQLLGEKVGETVGYRVRFENRISAQTRIEVVTEGILVRQIQDDPELTGIAALIFDEFHERSLDADLGLALALESQTALRDDLRLLVMSATLDGEPIAGLMGDCPVITSEGRAYPVETTYMPPKPQERIEPAMVAAIRDALANQKGSILAFLPGQGEITRVEGLLKSALSAEDRVIVAPLYGAMDAKAQDVAIQPAPDGFRKVVLATAIAETSLTIDGIRVVVDCGLQRLPRFDPASGMTRLVTVKSSQASAEQRRGRAGRLEPGICYRLWGEAEHRARPQFSAPEIAEADLAPLTLELARWGVSDVTSLPWLDVPDAAKIDQARDVLRRLEALDDAGRITQMGQAMASLPVHPRLAHMMVRGQELGLADAACALAALLSDRDFMRNAGADLRQRLEAMERGRAPGMMMEAKRQLSRRLAQAAKELAFGGGRGNGDQPKQPDFADQAGLLVAFAYPDRIGERRRGGEARYRLSGGRGGVLPREDRLANEQWLAVAELDGQSREAKIYLAAPLSQATLEEFFASQITTGTEVFWDTQNDMVVARFQRRIGALVLEEKPVHDAVAPDKLAQAMTDGIRKMGLSCLPWDKESEHLRARLAFLHGQEPETWPDMSDTGLLDHLEDWLMPYLSGIVRKAQLRQVNLCEALVSTIDWNQQQQIAKLAPSHWTVPTGSHIRIDYRPEGPALPVRLQEMFGATETPKIANGKVAVTLHLLSPAQRPLQVTSDLVGFWQGSYAQVKAEMKGRYPKHYWPDDPLQAEPTRRVKRPNN